MNLLESIKKRLIAIERIRQKDEILKNLKIVWETDIKKMQFEKLRSFNSIKRYVDLGVLRVEESDLSQHEYVDIFEGDIQSHMEMIDILLNGGKLIPPTRTEGYAIVDGTEKMVRPSKVSGFNDGTHRLNLAKYFGLDTIPVVVFKSFEGYWFTPEKWTFEQDQSGVKATSKTGQVITIKDGYVDDANTEYLIIHTRR